MIDPAAPIRIARPSIDLAAAERFYVGGLGCAVLWRAAAEQPGEHDLLMVGWKGASWHLELVAAPEPPRPTAEDLLVLYLGVTVADPDGYRLVLSSRTWSNG